MQQIPAGLRIEDFKKKYAELVVKSYEKRGEAWHCRECGTVAQAGEAYVSIHDTFFSGCAGGGEVKKIKIPGCPRCEPSGHTMHTCVHVGFEEFRPSELDNALEVAQV